MVPGLKHNSLMNASKSADEKYMTILTEYEVNIYCGKTTNKTVSEEAVLRGWRYKDTGLQRILIKKVVKNVNTETLLIKITDPKNAINNVYGPARTYETIQYLHACAGLPTKKTWITVIIAGNYNTWPVLIEKGASENFPE